MVTPSTTAPAPMVMKFIILADCSMVILLITYCSLSDSSGSRKEDF